MPIVVSMVYQAMQNFVLISKIMHHYFENLIVREPGGPTMHPPWWASNLFILFTISIQILWKVMAPRDFRYCKGWNWAKFEGTSNANRGWKWGKIDYISSLRSSRIDFDLKCRWKYHDTISDKQNEGNFYHKTRTPGMEGSFSCFFYSKLARISKIKQNLQHHSYTHTTAP